MKEKDEFEIMEKITKEYEILGEIMPFFIKNIYNALDEVEYQVALNDDGEIIFFSEKLKKEIRFDSFIEMLPVMFDEQLKTAIEASLIMKREKPVKFKRLSTKKIEEAKFIVKANTTEEEFKEISDFIDEQRELRLKKMI